MEKGEKMEKKEFVKAEAEVIRFEKTDIITTSYFQETGEGSGEGMGEE